MEKTTVVGRCWAHYHDAFMVPGCCSRCEECDEHILNGYMLIHTRHHHPPPQRPVLPPLFRMRRQRRRAKSRAS